MATVRFGDYNLTYDDTKGWSVDNVFPLPANWPPPIFILAMIPLMEKSKIGATPRQPLYNADKTTLYVVYLSYDETITRRPILVIGRLTEPRSELITVTPFPQLPPGDIYKWFLSRTRGIRSNEYAVMGGTAFLTFSPKPAIWSFALLYYPGSTYKWVGVVSGTPLDNPQNTMFVVFEPSEDALNHEYPIAPTNDGVLFRYSRIHYPPVIPPQRGSGTEKWLHVYMLETPIFKATTYPSPQYLSHTYVNAPTYISEGIELYTHLLPQEALSLIVAPREKILGFATDERTVVLSLYEELRWEWDELNDTFIQISDTTRTVLFSGLPFESAYKMDFMIGGVFYSTIYSANVIQRREAFLGVLTRTVTPPYPYKENALNRNLYTSADFTGSAYPIRCITPIHVEGDNHYAFICPATNKLLVADLFTGNIVAPVSIDSQHSIFWVAPSVVADANYASYLCRDAVRAGYSVTLPYAPAYIPMWFPYKAMREDRYGEIVLLKWDRIYMPNIIESVVEVAPNGEVTIRFTPPPTGDTIVSFAVENPPLGYLPYSYLGSSYIIADSVRDPLAWEMRVSDTEWKPFRGALKRETATQPPFEIRVKVMPLYSPFLRVIMRRV